MPDRIVAATRVYLGISRDGKANGLYGSVDEVLTAALGRLPHHGGGSNRTGLAMLTFPGDDCRPKVPWLWYYEMANVLLIQVHRKRIEFEEGDRGRRTRQADHSRASRPRS